MVPLNPDSILDVSEACPEEPGTSQEPNGHFEEPPASSNLSIQPVSTSLRRTMHFRFNV